MEFLKRSITIVLIVFFAINLKSQTTQEVINAFSESYEQEEKGAYNEAMEKLKAVYTEDAYEINLRLGWLAYQAGLFTESKAFYSKAIKLKPYAIEPKFGITYPASALGKWTEILDQYKKILEIAPNNTIAHYKTGLIYYGKEDYKTADTHFTKVVNLYPFDHDALLMLAWTKYQLQDYGKAKVLFNKALMYNPSDESAQKGLDSLK